MSRPGRAIAFAAAVLAGLTVAGLAFVTGIIVLARQWARKDEFPRFAVEAVWAGDGASARGHHNSLERRAQES